MRWRFIGPPLDGPVTLSDQLVYTNSLREMRKAALHHVGDGAAVQHDYTEARISDDPADILLGLVTVDSACRGAGAPDSLPDWVRESRLDDGAAAHPNTYLLYPGPPAYTFPEIQRQLTPYHDRQLDAARLIFAMQGRYWFERWRALDDGSVFARVKHKIVRVNCACDAWRLPASHVRSGGGFLHCSNLTWCKNPAALFKAVIPTPARLYVASHNPAARGHFVQGPDGAVAGNVFGLGGVDNANAAFCRFVRDDCDFYIQTSRLDAQSTAVLEAAARGLVPLLTPQTGFASPHALILGEDAAANRAVVAQAMAMDPEDYEARSRGVRAQVMRYHGWRMLFERIAAVIARDQRGEPVAGDIGPEGS